MADLFDIDKAVQGLANQVIPAFFTALNQQTLPEVEAMVKRLISQLATEAHVAINCAEQMLNGVIDHAAEQARAQLNGATVSGGLILAPLNKSHQPAGGVK